MRPSLGIGGNRARVVRELIFSVRREGGIFHYGARNGCGVLAG